jgi:hypothetical protein
MMLFFIPKTFPELNLIMRFQVLTAASMKMTAFRDVEPCTLLEIYDVSEVLTASITHRHYGEGSKLL